MYFAAASGALPAARCTWVDWAEGGWAGRGVAERDVVGEGGRVAAATGAADCNSEDHAGKAAFDPWQQHAFRSGWPCTGASSTVNLGGLGGGGLGGSGDGGGGLGGGGGAAGGGGGGLQRGQGKRN